jgi:hypothetical protein
VPAPTPIASLLQPSPANAPLSPEFRKKLDRLGYLQGRYSTEKYWIDELDVLNKAVQAHFKDAPANEPIHAEGELYAVDLTQRENQQKITDKSKAFSALRKAMGITALIDALSYTVKLLDAHVPKDRQAAFVANERTGPRTLRSSLILAKAA